MPCMATVDSWKAFLLGRWLRTRPAFQVEVFNVLLLVKAGGCRAGDWRLPTSYTVLPQHILEHPWTGHILCRLFHQASSYLPKWIQKRWGSTSSWYSALGMLSYWIDRRIHCPSQASERVSGSFQWSPLPDPIHPSSPSPPLSGLLLSLLYLHCLSLEHRCLRVWRRDVKNAPRRARGCRCLPGLCPAAECEPWGAAHACMLD